MTSITAGIGGAERVVLTLARTLGQRGIEVMAAFPEGDQTPELLEWFHRDGANACASPAVRSLNQSRGVRDMARFWRFIRRNRPTVVNLHYGGNHISFKDVAVVRLAGKRCVVQVQHAEEIQESRKRLLTAIAGHLAHAVVVTTPVMSDILVRSGVPADKIHIIPCGVLPPAEQPARERARAEFGFPDDAFVISSLARLSPSKGMATLIEAVAGLPDSVWLVIAGDGEERERLAQLGRALMGERFVMLGRISRPEALYAASDLFALASRSEGFGLVFIEAALHGIPSVAFDIGGVKYAVLDEVTGLLAPDGDVAALRAAIDRLRRDRQLAHRLGQAARERAFNELSADTMADRYMAVLDLDQDVRSRRPAGPLRGLPLSKASLGGADGEMSEP